MGKKAKSRRGGARLGAGRKSRFEKLEPYGGAANVYNNLLLAYEQGLSEAKIDQWIADKTKDDANWLDARDLMVDLNAIPISARRDTNGNPSAISQNLQSEIEALLSGKSRVFVMPPREYTIRARGHLSEADRSSGVRREILDRLSNRFIRELSTERAFREARENDAQLIEQYRRELRTILSPGAIWDAIKIERRNRLKRKNYIRDIGLGHLLP